MKSIKEKWNTRVEMVSVLFICVNDNTNFFTLEKSGSEKNPRAKKQANVLRFQCEAVAEDFKCSEDTFFFSGSRKPVVSVLNEVL